MNRRLMALMPLVLAAAVAITASPAPAQAAAPPAHRVTLTITQQGGASRSVVLDCDTGGGSHPRAAEACQVLASVTGNIAAIPPRRGYCLTLHAPVTARATGEWAGAKLSYSRIHSNYCFLQLATAPVFSF